MFSSRSFSVDWICSIAKRTGAQDVIVEKSIHALALVERLAEAGLNFVLKGGTSLLLLLIEAGLQDLGRVIRELLCPGQLWPND